MRLLAVGAGATRLVRLGSVPFESPVLMWWSFVDRSRAPRDYQRQLFLVDHAALPLELVLEQVVARRHRDD